MKTKDTEKLIKITSELREHIAENKEYDYSVLTQIFKEDELYELSVRLEDANRVKHIEDLLAHADKNKIAQRLRHTIQQKQNRKRRMILYLTSTSAAAVLFAVSMFLFYPQNKSIEMATLDSHIAEPLLITTLGDSLRDDSSIQNYTVTNNEVPKKESYNQMIVPTGCTYTFKLPDSTEVMLNSNSRLIFPDTFCDSCRNVTLIGEAYFRVTKGKKPFIVTINNVEVKVYGTEFNINAQHENVIQTLLVEGSVGVRCGDNHTNELKLSPNQLCNYNETNHHGDVLTVNVTDYLSWRENIFLYNERTLSVVLADFKAWYGVKFNIKETVSTRLMTLRMSRGTELKDMLSLLEKAADVKFIQKSATEYEVE